MGDFSEHVLFGFLTAAVAGYVMKSPLSAGFFESLSSLLLLFAGSVFPDVDHENSYVHRAVKSFLSISAGASMLLLPLKLHFRFAAAVLVFAVAFVAVSRLRPRHRGYLHSVRFAFFASCAVVSVTVLVSGSVVPGAAFALGLFSHLLLDRELF